MRVLLAYDGSATAEKGIDMLCQSPLLPATCDIDPECEADCRGLGHINVACEPSRAW